MISAPILPNESARLQALASYKILDTLPEPVYEEATRLAVEISGSQLAFLAFVDKDREWFKSKQGTTFEQAPRAFSFCAHAILEPSEIMVVPDARYDERFYDNPLTVGNPHIVFYTAIPLRDDQGFALGALAVVDSRPRVLSDIKLLMLKALGKLVETQIELRKSKIQLAGYHHC